MLEQNQAKFVHWFDKHRSTTGGHQRKALVIVLAVTVMLAVIAGSGSQGVPGPQGPPGPQGAAGAPGPQGSAGPAAAEAELEFTSEGKGVAENIEYIGHDGKTRMVGSDQSKKPGGLDLKGHGFTFSFRAVKEDGWVKGFVKLEDPKLGISVYATNFEIDQTHPKHKIPGGGFEGPDAVDMRKTTGTTVFINGVLQPDWKFDNGPLFVG